MSRTFWICMVFFVAGVIIVALPDSGPRIFSLNEQHGPSIVDMAGLILMVVPWLWLLTYATIHWRRVLDVLGRRLAAIALSAGVAGLVVIIISLGRAGPYWWMGALLAFAGQLTWIAAAFMESLPRR